MNLGTVRCLSQPGGSVARFPVAVGVDNGDWGQGCQCLEAAAVIEVRGRQVAALVSGRLELKPSTFADADASLRCDLDQSITFRDPQQRLIECLLDQVNSALEVFVTVPSEAVARIVHPTQLAVVVVHLSDEVLLLIERLHNTVVPVAHCSILSRRRTAPTRLRWTAAIERNTSRVTGPS